jgi:hypothetical protein
MDDEEKKEEEENALKYLNLLNATVGSIEAAVLRVTVRLVFSQDLGRSRSAGSMANAVLTL